MKPSRNAAIILAGGFSTRMKQFKPLLPLRNGTILDHVIATFKNADIDVLLVVGFNKEAILSSIGSRDIMVIFNPDYKKGMFTSVQAGVRELKPEHRSFFILPVDIPLVAPSTIHALMETSMKNPSMILFPIFKGKKGHPPLIPTTLANVITGYQKDGSLKDVLKEYENRSMQVQVDDEYILFDVDTMDDYQKLLKYYYSGIGQRS